MTSLNKKDRTKKCQHKEKKVDHLTPKTRNSVYSILRITPLYNYYS